MSGAGTLLPSQGVEPLRKENGVTAPLCRVELFGGLRLVTPTQTIVHFRTQKTALLLAYLAANLHHTHPREALIDLLWEDSDIDTGRTSLRVALSALRKQFQQAGVPPHEAFYSDNLGIGLRSGTVTTDLREMEQNIRLAHRTSDCLAQVRYLQRAVDCYVGIPLNGFYDEWVLQLQQRTAEQYFRALDELIVLLEQTGDRETAQEYALRGIAFDPLREEPRMALMRIHLARGYPMEARRVYRRWEDLAREELDAAPSHAMRQIAQSVESAARQALHSAQMLCESKLPPTPVKLLGRERETAYLTELLHTSSTRLITITGEGGIGKTALAIEVARRAVGKGRRTWFVEVSDVREENALLEHILRTAGAAQYAEQPMDSAMQILGGYPSLLVLDNFEQVDATGARVVSELLQQLPLLQILVTSRHKIGLPEEKVLRLSPLESPTAGAWQDESGRLSANSALETLEQCASVRVFVHYAQSVRAGFQLTPENAPAVAEICRCLEGLPLALILAASRARVLSPSQILRTIQQQIDVLSLPHASPPERHRSIHASLEWSYALLSPELKRAFVMLAVFKGGWDLAAAVYVLTGQTPDHDGASNVAVLDILDALIESSLVYMDEQDREARYRMLEVVRRYALEKLQGEPYVEDALARHFLFYSQLAACANQNRLGTLAARWAAKVALEHQNMIAAIEYALNRDSSHSSAVALQMAAHLWVFWMMRGFLAEGRDLLKRLVAEYTGATDKEVSHWWAWMQGDLLTAERILRQNLCHFEQEGDAEGQAFAMIWLGNVLYRMGEYEQAESKYARAEVVAEEAQNLEARTYATMWRGNLAQRAGDIERAMVLYQSCLRFAEENNDWYALGFVHYNLGQIALREGDHAECAQRLLCCLRVRAQIDDLPGLLEALESFAILCTCVQWDEAGAQLLGACESLRQKLHLPSSPPHLHDAGHILRCRMGEGAYQQQIERGRSLPLQEALALVEALV